MTNTIPFVVNIPIWVTDPTGNNDPFLKIKKTSQQGTDFLYIMPSVVNAHNRSPGLPRESGSWLLISQIGAFSPQDVSDKLAAGTAYVVSPNDILDMRFVDQFFTPHTYNDASPVKGYTFTEWTNGFTPGGLGGIWYSQWLTYNSAVLLNAQPFPNHFDFEAYAWRELLKAAWIAWNDEAVIRAPNVDDTLNDTANPFPFARMRLTFIGERTP